MVLALRFRIVVLVNFKQLIKRIQKNQWYSGQDTKQQYVGSNSILQEAQRTLQRHLRELNFRKVKISVRYFLLRTTLCGNPLRDYFLARNLYTTLVTGSNTIINARFPSFACWLRLSRMSFTFEVGYLQSLKSMLFLVIFQVKFHRLRKLSVSAFIKSFKFARSRHHKWSDYNCYSIEMQK